MPALSKEFLDIQATIEYEFTLKHVRDMTRTYSKIYCLKRILRQGYTVKHLFQSIS